MAEQPIRYSDLIQPDNSIEQAIEQLEKLNKAYSEFLKAIREEAVKLQASMKGLSGTTEQYRTAIQEAAAQAERLSRAYDDLVKAQSTVQAAMDAVRQKQQQAAQATNTAAQASQSAATAAQAEAKSYGQLRSGIDMVLGTRSENIKRMAEEQAAISDINARLKELQKQQAQSYSASVAKRIETLTNELLTHKTALAEVRQVLNNLAKLENAAPGSMDEFSQQLGRMRMAYRAMTDEMKKSPFGQELLASIQKLDKEMKELDATIGNHQRNVGNYASGWNGLSVSIQQVARELPSLAVGWNTFFLAISNNLPILADEISRARKEYEALKKSGQKAVPVWKQVAKSIVSWQTALTVGITLLTLYGGKIVEWAKKALTGRKTAISMAEAVKKVNEAMEEANGNYGDNIVMLKNMQSQWKSLSSETEKNNWIKNNTSAFNQLGVAVNGVSDAENIFTKNTEAVVLAMQQRAKAAAAQKLASEQYEKALMAQIKIEQAQQEREEALEKSAIVTQAEYATPGSAATATRANRQEVIKAEFDWRIKRLEEEKEAANEAADAYFRLNDMYEELARNTLKDAGISGSDQRERSSSRKPKDLTDTISRNDIKIRKSYEESITDLIQDEYAKRRKAAADQVQNENGNLSEMLRKNEEYVKNAKGLYKSLTDDQKKEIERQQEMINKTIENNMKALEIELQKIKNEQAVASLQVQRESVNTGDTGKADEAAESGGTVVTTNIVVTRDISQLEASLVKERQLMAENLDLEYAMVLAENKKLLEAGDEHARSEEEITAELEKKKLALYAQYDQQILEARERDIEAQLAVVKKGSDDELKLLLQQNEIRRQLALAGNAAKPVAEQVDTSSINAQYDKSAKSIEGNFTYGSLEEQQKLDALIFNEVQRSAQEIANFRLLQQRELLNTQIGLAETGALDWSDTEVQTAKTTVDQINKELEKVGIGLDVKSTDYNGDEESGFTKLMGSISEKGIGGTLLESLGLDGESIAAIQDACSQIVSSLSEVMEARVELAELAVEAAQEEVDAAQSAVDSEIEARNNGYASNVSAARAELALAKEKEQQALKEKEKAQKQQEAIDTAQQASSLITATAQILAAYMGMPFVGKALAAAAIASMWAMFAAAKVMASKVTSSESSTSSSAYGEGGIEFLKGGSHASGHDIDLGVDNSKGRRMRAEGGEALAIINKRRTRKYRRALPAIIQSLNDGTFEKKFAEVGTEFSVLGTEFRMDTGGFAGTGTGKGSTAGMAALLDSGEGALMRMMESFSGGGGMRSTPADLWRPGGAMNVPHPTGIVKVEVMPQPQQGADLGRLEGDVRKIREQAETRCWTLPDGRMVVQRKNVKRIIRR